MRKRLVEIYGRKKKTIDTSTLALCHSYTLPSIGSDSQLSQRSQQSRLRRNGSRKEYSKSLSQKNPFSDDSDASPTFFPTTLSSQSCHGADTTPTEAVAASTAVDDQNVSPPSILHSYKEKSSSSAIKNLSIPWLNDSDDDRSIMSTKRTVLRPIVKRRVGRLLVV